MKKLLVICIFVSAWILIGCNSTDELGEIELVKPLATETSEASFTFTPMPTTTQTSTLTPSQTPTLSVTPSPTSTSTLTETPSPTTIPQAMVEVAFANVYSGVAQYLPVMARFANEIALKVIGVTPDDEWLLVEVAPGQNGWIRKSDVHLANSEVILNTVEAPIPPTITPTSVAPPRVSVGFSTDDFYIEYFNFQPKENLTVTVYTDGGSPKTFGSSTFDNGYGHTKMTWIMKLKKGSTYRVVVNGNKGSFAETTFTYKK